MQDKEKTMKYKNLIEPQETKNASQNTSKKTYVVLIALLFFVGFISGQYYETSSRNTVYLVKETKLLKLVAVGLALEDKEKGKEEVLDKDKKRIKATMKNLSRHLSEYSKYPVLIEQKNDKGYELYRGVKKIDITEEIIIKLIGKEKWETIGKVFSQR